MLLSPVWFTGSWWRGGSTSLEFIQVFHQNVGPVVVENLQHMIATVFTENLLDFFHVVSLFVLDHLKTLVRDQLGLHQKLFVFISCGLNSITNLEIIILELGFLLEMFGKTNPAVELFFAFLV